MSIFLSSLIATLASVFGFINEGPVSLPQFNDGELQMVSVEIGLAELSPLGVAGGLAVPASGESSCSAAMTPSQITQGESATVTWTEISGGYSGSYSLSRCNASGTGCVQLEFGSALFDDETASAQSEALAPGAYVYRIAQYAVVNLSGWGSCGTGDFNCTPVTYVCDTQLIVGAAPNLQSTSINVPTTATVGSSATITGVVRNNSTVNVTSPFADEFSYRWSTSGAWIPFGTKPPHATGLNSNQQRTDTSSSFTFNQAGTVYFQHCVDWNNVIAESNETAADNCTQSAGVTVGGGPPTVTLSANPAIVPGIGSTTTLTWNVRNNATSCTASNGWSGSKAFSNGVHNQSGVTVGSDPTTYRITCSNSYGSAFDEAVVSVEDEVVGEIEPCDPNDRVIRQGEEVEICWETNDPPQCVIRLGGREIIGPLTENSGQFTWVLNSEGTFILYCGKEVDRTTIRVLPIFQET